MMPVAPPDVLETHVVGIPAAFTTVASNVSNFARVSPQSQARDFLVSQDHRRFFAQGRSL